jgi:hypothetical protein
MLSEHQRLIEFMTKNVPGFIPPTDFKPLKKIRRIIIPQEKVINILMLLLYKSIKFLVSRI